MDPPVDCLPDPGPDEVSIDTPSGEDETGLGNGDGVVPA